MTRIKIDDLLVAEGLSAEQEALILGAGLKSFRPRLEALEVREVPTITLGATGVLTIQGEGLSAQAKVSMVDGPSGNRQVQVSLDDGPSGNRQVQVNLFDETQVKSIVFDGTGGNDRFTNDTSKSSTAYGYGGNDVLIGGSGNDVLYGGDGNDTLYARSVNTKLYGGAGADLFLVKAQLGFGGDGSVKVQ